MDNPSLNLLKPTTSLPPDPKNESWVRKVAYFFVGLFCIVALVGGERLVHAARATDGAASNSLKPKLGFFQTIKNLIFNTDPVLDGQSDDRINILILGIGGEGHDGPYLSDTNIIVSIKPSTKEVALISVPRDLGVKINEYGWRKINAADAIGESKEAGHGGDYARQVFVDQFHLPIPYYVRIDFTAFQELIDAVGGVTVNVPNSFVDTQFPGPNNSYQTISFTTGQQTLNGVQALNYARSRHGNNGEGSDFARARRQQLILEALKAKLLSFGTLTNPLLIQKLYNSVTDHVDTNLDNAQLIYLAKLAKSYQGAIKSLVLDSSPRGFLVDTTGEQGAFILAPKTGNFDAINTAIASVFDASSTVAQAPPPVVGSETAGHPVVAGSAIEIQNGTWRVGLAARIRQELESKGFSILTIGNTLKRPQATTTIYVLNSRASSAVATQLAHTFNAPISSSIPDWLKENYDDPATAEQEQGMKYNDQSDILVILGTDLKE